MSSMTDPTNPGTITVADGHVVHLCCGRLDDAGHRSFCPQYQPVPVKGADWSPERREGYAEGYVDCAAVVAGRVTSESLAAVRSLTAQHAEPSCPEWCTLEHDALKKFDLVTHMGDDHLDGIGRKLLDGHVEIQVARTDELGTGTMGVPNLYVRCELELTTWEQAAELARAILDGFGYLEGADRG